VKNRDPYDELIDVLAKLGAFAPHRYATKYDVTWKETLYLSLATILQQQERILARLDGVQSTTWRIEAQTRKPEAEAE
jgi:hypothetical protein